MKAFREGINVELFEAVLTFLVEYHLSFDMTTFEREEECGAVMCFAGATNMLTGKDNQGLNDSMCETHARESLGLSQAESRRLFYASLWPTEFFLHLSLEIPGSARYAEVALGRFRHFLKTGE